MGRPPTQLGTHGRINITQVEPQVWEASTRFRDWDGHSRRVRRTGGSKTKAEQNLKAAIRDRRPPGCGELRPTSSVADCAQRWLKEVQRKDRGTTYDRYVCRMSRILPALGKLRLIEVGTETCDLFLAALLDSGLAPSTVRGYRSALSGIMGYAVRKGVLTRNPVQDVADIRGRGKRSRALTPAERVDFLAKLDGDRLAVEQDLPSLLRYMLGSGVRIGEVLALQWSSVDLERGLAIHGSTLVRKTRECEHCGEYRKKHPKPARRCPDGKDTWVPGPGGLVLHPPKTSAGVRIIKLPRFVVDLLRLRYPGDEYRAAPVFPNRLGEWRDPINTCADIREWRKRVGIEWKFTSHVARHTMFTICDQAGVSARESAGHGGHTDPGFTAKWYYDLRQQSGAVAEALDAAYRVGPPSLRS